MSGPLQNSQPLYFRALTVLIWTALPANAVLYAAWWDRLPRTLATHFNFANQPNGWMSREGSFGFAMFFATLLAVIATVILLRVKKPDAAAWGLLGLFYVIEGTLLWAENAIIGYNAQDTPVNAAPVFAVGIGAAVLAVILALATRRGDELSATSLLARETHSSPAFAALMALPAIAFVVVIAKAPLGGVKLVMGVGMVLMLAGAAMAGTGFQYLFTGAGVEVRTLGFRLRSIPAYDIKSYALDTWNFFGGYGIRGIGERRAYVWGNRGVRIKTFDGEIFLGHDNPEKIVRDLDLVTQNDHQEHEVARRL